MDGWENIFDPDFFHSTDKGLSPSLPSLVRLTRSFDGTSTMPHLSFHAKWDDIFLDVWAIFIDESI